MRNSRGQASILIAIIFQILFIFFAMIINVGLLVNDKINLQNSTDIAAYYGAMKQAEVLNAMAQLNFQIRQAYKLLAWRVWVLGDAGRNSDFLMNGNPPVPPEIAENWGGDAFSAPIVCVGNSFWGDSNAKPGQQAQDLCKQSTLSINKVQPLPLTLLQSVFVLPAIIFSQQIAGNAAVFNQTFKDYAPKNYDMAAKFLASYKIAVARRRFAIKQLQDYLIQGATDFKDIDGQSVNAMVVNTLEKNLTAANLGSIESIDFENGLNNKPFMVPIQVRLWIYYENYSGTATTQNGNPQALDTQANEDTGGALYKASEVFWSPDYVNSSVAETAAQFAGEPTSDFSSNPNSFYSLVGFEKNPWVMAYVSVKATTHPKMLFSPFAKGGKSQITLTAESYAMPFGGKMGPWYFTEWPKNSEASQGQAGASVIGGAMNLTKVDPLLPDRMDAPAPKTPIVYSQAVNQSPNYSRYPGDTLGMSSHLARFQGANQIIKAIPQGKVADYYALIFPNSDPLISDPKFNTTPPNRPFEIQAIMPDLFDAAYYSVEYNFPDRYRNEHSKFLSDLCMPNDNIPCYDLGSTFVPTPSQASIATIMGTYQDVPPVVRQWRLHAPEHLNTSWSQGDPGQYSGDAVVKMTVGQRWYNTDQGTGQPQGGRAGYSVKIVSKQFLQRPDFPLGGGQNPNGGAILNPPQ